MVLTEAGFAPDLVRWLGGWLENRSAEMLVDGVATDVLVSAGVPQGSPMSPALFLFLLFLRPLYERLRRAGIVLTGFVDGISLVAFGRTYDECCETLQGAYRDAEGWARIVGLQFQPSKSGLIHFQKRGNYQRSLQLGGSKIAPVDNVRLLGIWLDKRLC